MCGAQLPAAVKKTGRRQKMTTKPMTKTQLVATLAEEMGADKKTAAAALDSIAAIVSREVAAGGAVTLPGIGKVACRARPERQVRNPATGETLTKPADRAVKVTIAKALKDAVA
jgi:DNA-binding protein HU-beta